MFSDKPIKDDDSNFDRDLRHALNLASPKGYHPKVVGNYATSPAQAPDLIAIQKLNAWKTFIDSVPVGGTGPISSGCQVPDSKDRGDGSEAGYEVIPKADLI